MHDDLNLAGSQGVPSPQQLSRSTSTRSAIIPPSYGRPNLSTPPLERANLAQLGLTLHPSFTPDPLLPTLADYSQPTDLDIISTDNQQQLLTPDVDAAANAATQAMLADGFGFSALSINHDVAMPDPLVADMQQPTLTPEVTMQERPAEMDPTALADLDDELLAQLLIGKHYPDVQMDQRGYNATLARHMTLLLSGLRDEEA